MRPIFRRSHLAAVCAVVALTAIACGGSMTPSNLQPTVATITTLPTQAEMLAERTIGAPTGHTIVEYLSFRCSGCATFYLNNSAQMKTRFVDTGRAQIVFRNVYLSGETLVAAALARCVPASRYFDAVDRIFRTQSTWGNSADPDAAVKTQMLGFGMSQQVIDQCLANGDLLNLLLSVHNTTANQIFLLPSGSSVTGLTYIPAVAVDGVLLDGTTTDNAVTLDNIDKLLK